MAETDHLDYSFAHKETSCTLFLKDSDSQAFAIYLIQLSKTSINNAYYLKTNKHFLKTNKHFYYFYVLGTYSSILHSHTFWAWALAVTHIVLACSFLALRYTV